MQAGGPERFIDIDIAQAGDAALVEQQGFQAPFEAGELFAENRQGKGAMEGFGPQMGQVGLGIRDDEPASEFAGITVTEAAAVVERQDEAVMVGGRAGGGCPVELAGHTKMDEQIRTAGEMENDVFGPTFKGLDGLTLKRGDKTGGCEGRDGAVPEDFDLAERAPFNTGPAQIAHDRFNFGQFRHEVLLRF
jgi:hypothetical protein